MTPRLSNLFPWRNRSQRSPEAAQMLALFHEVVNERNDLDLKLKYALETIKMLQSQIAEYDFLLLQTQSHMLKKRRQKTPEKQHLGNNNEKPPVETHRYHSWIAGIWLCSADTFNYLEELERLWVQGQTQRAINAAFRLLATRRKTDVVNKLRCRLFLSAVYHSCQRYHESEKQLEVVIEMLNEPDFSRPSMIKELAGIARFIQGCNWLATGELQAAYWAFARALHTPGYHDRARDLQKETVNRCAEEGVQPSSGTYSASPFSAESKKADWASAPQSQGSVHSGPAFENVREI
ncbi:hypothetical protein ASPZODRAFT_11985 [Penicilliopsis zonata CBS 506.65]|uniref:Uncharacterized protein n=1 Tax=Penicilliopsis zonata CBS 506.65 TaxID=1073090 RepID=A0A1L9SV80_9EURO|nr:hypothetical protein ASPZODRAFT_11985 [Penicilliopsis zonata CBS 506.65]OJJ51142.1 hypothetical protein ASPZODRAFT_11985 [Penicilliopsis zonata CBS 506.65]